MTIDFFDNTLDDLRARRPFRPFVIALVNGERFKVDHPGALAVRSGTGMYIAPGSVPHWFDHEGVSQIIGDLLHQGK